MDFSHYKFNFNKMSWIQQEMHTIAVNMNKKPAQLAKVLATLEENMIDTEEDFMSLDEKVLDKMNIPPVITKHILERIKQRGEGQKPVMVSENQLSGITNMSGVSKKYLEELLDAAYQRCHGSDKCMGMLFIMKKLIENVINNPKNEKMRRINLSNPKIAENIGQYPSNVKFFQVIGWDEIEEGLLLYDHSYNKENLELGLACIESFALKLQKLINSLGKTGISGTTGMTSTDVAQKTGGLSDYGDLLEKELERRKDMKKPIKNRKVQYKKHDADLKMKKFERQQTENENEMMDEEDMIEEPSKMSHADLVRIQEMFAGDSKFKSKRQQELEKLVKQPVITQILIKFKLWNEDEILAIFSP